jgi:two-component system nitrate/nitrite response regulator NarL
MHLLIVDDHPMTCAGLRSLLQACYPQARIDTLQQLDAEAAGGRWDYLFLDMHLPGLRFEDALERLAPRLSRVILISAAPEPEAVDLARRRGVCGLLLKNADIEHLLDGFRRIQSGEKVFVDAGEMIGLRAPPQETLTERQRHIYEALLGGFSNKQIARTLGISEYTVKEHVTAILTVFGVRNRLELVLRQQRPPVV